MIKITVAYLILKNSMWGYCVLVYDPDLEWTDDNGNQVKGAYDRVATFPDYNPNGYKWALFYMNSIRMNKYLLPKHLHAKYIPTYNFPSTPIIQY